jgi:uncharacterized protein YkwD
VHLTATTARHVRAPSVRARATRRLGAAGFVAAALSSIVLVVTAGAASAGSAGGFVAAINAARSANGVAPLAVAGDLAAAASRQASSMAGSGVLAHTPNLASAICCWTAVGENVGEGPSVSSIAAAFLASPDHRANILNRAYTQVGIGTAVDAHGVLWVSEIFRRPADAPATVVTRVVTKPLVVPAPAPPPPAAKPVATIVRPPIEAATSPVEAGTLPAGPVSRDLVRAPLAVAQQLAAQLLDRDQVSGADPVSTLLDFAAKASE